MKMKITHHKDYNDHKYVYTYIQNKKKTRLWQSSLLFVFSDWGKNRCKLLRSLQLSLNQAMDAKTLGDDITVCFHP